MVGITGSFGGSFLPAMLLFQTLESSRDKQLAQLKDEPLIRKEVDYFRENAPKVETVEDFLDDRRLMAFALRAFAMEGEINLMGRMRKVMSEPLSDPKALANVLIDPRFEEIAKAFQFGLLGTGKLKLISFINDVVDQFYTNEFERRLGEQNPALREAEFFRRKIGEIDNTFDILGDRVFRAVVTFTLDLPVEIVFQSVDTQKGLIDARVDIEDFKDPEFVEDFLRRFLIKKDAEANQIGFGIGAGRNAHLLQLFQSIGGGGFNFLV